MEEVSSILDEVLANQPKEQPERAPGLTGRVDISLSPLAYDISDERRDSKLDTAQAKAKELAEKRFERIRRDSSVTFVECYLESVSLAVERPVLQQMFRGSRSTLEASRDVGHPEISVDPRERTLSATYSLVWKCMTLVVRTLR